MKYAKKFGVRDKYSEAIIPPSLSVPNPIFEKMNELPPTEFEQYIAGLQQTEKDFYNNYSGKKYLSYQLKYFMDAMVDS